MLKQKIFFLIPFAFVFISLGLMFPFATPAHVAAQQPTGSIPTVTGTPSGMVVRVRIDQSNELVTVYAGPSASLYPPVGVILMGQELPVLGISADREWLQVYYPGIPESVAWVYGPYVEVIQNGRVPEAPAPSTPTLASTPALDPTLAAAFIDPVTPTRLPTFTPAPDIVVSTFLPEEEVNRVPIGLIILILGFIGGFGVLISFLRAR